MLFKGLALTLYVLSAFVCAFPMKAAYHEGLKGIVPRDTIDDQVPRIQRALPDEMYFNITSPSPGRPEIPGRLCSLWCVPNTLHLPPNTEDCSLIGSTIFRLNTSIELSANACLTMIYRSCLMYNCATPSGGMNVSTHRWWTELDAVREDCVEGQGSGGCLPYKNTLLLGGSLYITGIQHIEDAFPHWWPDSHELGDC